MAIKYLDEEKTEKVSPKIRYFEKNRQMEAQNIGGVVENVPSAAIRSMLQGKGYTQGAMNPSAVPKFQDLALENFAPKTQSTLLNFLGGMPASAAGMAADVATNPAELLTFLMGGIGGKTIAKNMASIGKNVKTALKWEGSLEQAKKAKSSLDTVRTTLGKAKELAIKEVENVPATLDWKGNVSGKIVEAIRNPVYGVQFTEEGGVVNTVGNLDKVKTAVGELITPKVWQEAPKTELRQIKQFYGRVVGEMKKAAEKAGKPITKVLDDYDNFMERYNIIDDHLTDKYGNAMGNKLKTSFKVFAEPALKEAWGVVSKATPELKSVTKSMKTREILKNLLAITALASSVKAGEGVVRSLKP